MRKICVATLIARQWALTAAHCTDETSLGVATARGGTFAVEVAGQSREVDLVVKHPRYQQGAVDDIDLALIRFKAPLASPSPITLNMAKDELSKVVTIVGWGYFGVGTLGRQYADGRMRYATNRISDQGDIYATDSMILARQHLRAFRRKVCWIGRQRRSSINCHSIWIAFGGCCCRSASKR